MSATAPLPQPGHGRKVLIVVENLSVPFDRRVWRECQALTQAGYRVSTISPMGADRDTRWREVIDGVAVYRYPMYSSSGGFVSYLLEYANALLMSFVLMWVVLAREGFDAIQICNPPDLLMLPALPFKLLGKRVVFDQHDICPEIYETQRNLHGRTNRVMRVLYRLEAMTYALSDVVMVVNESCRRIAIGRGGRSESDVFVVRNGPTRQSIRDAAPNDALRKGKPHLLVYVGMMGPQEGIDVMLRVIRDLRVVHRRDDFHVHIVGGGTVLEAMRAYAAELGIDGVVTFTGSVDHARVMEAISSADLCLCPDPKTPLSDKCSLVKAIEYMSLGRGFVAFDLEEVRLLAGPAAEFARPGDEADFAERVHRLLDDPQRRDEMGRRGREEVQGRLTWEHAQQELLRAYEHALRGRGRVAAAGSE